MKKHYRRHVKLDRKKIKGHDCAPLIARALVKKFSGTGWPAIVAVGGPGGIGKSTFAARLADLLKDAEVLRLDDYKTSREHRRSKGLHGPHPEANRHARFMIAEGEISTYRDFHDLVDFSVFIDSHWKTQLKTRINRDIEERGYSPERAIEAFLQSNLREFASHGAESKNWADVHVHCGDDYGLLIDALCSRSLSL